MSRALVALDALRELTDGTSADLAALLSEIVLACPIAGPWREVRLGLILTWHRSSIARIDNGPVFPVVVETEIRSGKYVAFVRGATVGRYAFPVAARDACDERLRALGWVLL